VRWHGDEARQRWGEAARQPTRLGGAGALRGAAQGRAEMARGVRAAAVG